MVKHRKKFLAFGKPLFGDEEKSAVSRVLDSGWVGMGQETVKFEAELRSFLHASNVITTNSCTSALFLSLLAENVSAGDEVICPSLTWCSTANVAMYAKAKPVFCDVDEETWCVSIDSILNKISEKTRAVIVVHYGGLAVDVENLRAALPAHISIIEDAAHAFGSRYQSGQMVGSSGNPTCFSFYANKNLATAEGGAIAIGSNRKAEKLISLRLHGLPNDAWKRFEHPEVMLKAGEITDLGYKMNYTDLQSAIGRVQLRRQTEFAKTRKMIAAYYASSLAEHSDIILMQKDILSESHARHLFVIRLSGISGNKRNEIIQKMREFNIGATLHYNPLHLMPLYNSNDSLPVTEQLVNEIITLPIGANMNLDDAKEVIEKLNFVLFKQNIIKGI